MFGEDRKIPGTSDCPGFYIKNISFLFNKQFNCTYPLIQDIINYYLIFLEINPWFKIGFIKFRSILIITFIHSPSSSFILPHLPPSSLIFILSPSSSFIRPCLYTSSLIFIHPPSSSLILPHLHPSFLIFIHPPSSSFILPHLYPFFLIFIHTH